MSPAPRRGCVRKLLLPPAALTALVFVLQGACAAIATKHSAGPGGDFTISCNSGPFSDYAAMTASGVPLSDPYAVARGADKGLVRMMSEGGRQRNRYAIPRARIRAVVRVKLDADIPDWVDLVFTRGALMVIHTSTANAGIFTTSDVYRLSYDGKGRLDETPLRHDETVRHMLNLGRALYPSPETSCRPPPGR